MEEGSEVKYFVAVGRAFEKKNTKQNKAEDGRGIIHEQYSISIFNKVDHDHRPPHKC